MSRATTSPRGKSSGTSRAAARPTVGCEAAVAFLDSYKGGAIAGASNLDWEALAIAPSDA